jgi:hypothetical protein
MKKLKLKAKTLKKIMETEEDEVARLGDLCEACGEPTDACTCNLCQVCGKNSDNCSCTCPVCGEPCFDDVTIADHGRCYDCHHAILNGEIDAP